MKDWAVKTFLMKVYKADFDGVVDWVCARNEEEALSILEEDYTGEEFKLTRIGLFESFKKTIVDTQSDDLDTAAFSLRELVQVYPTIIASTEY